MKIFKDCFEALVLSFVTLGDKFDHQVGYLKCRLASLVIAENCDCRLLKQAA